MIGFVGCGYFLKATVHTKLEKVNRKDNFFHPESGVTSMLVVLLLCTGVGQWEASEGSEGLLSSSGSVTPVILGKVKPASNMLP